MRILPILIVLAALPLAAQELARRPFEAEGFAAYTAGDFAKCRTIFASGAKVHPEEPSPALMAARCSAKAGNAKDAQHYLAIAMARGYRNCGPLTHQSEFAPFRDELARCEANAEAFVKSSNAEVLAAYLGDQAERAQEITDIEAAKKRDAARLNAVKIAIAQHALHTADDYFHAAMVLQHGGAPETYAQARDFAKKAVELRPWFGNARWLYAAATDRYLQSIGKPQIYGTQMRFVDGAWTAEPFDTKAISDAERARWRVRSLAETEAFVRQANAPK